MSAKSAASPDSLERATRIEGGNGHFRLELSTDWFGLNGLYGGYLAAVNLRAAAEASGFERAASHTCHFLSGAQPGPAELEVTSLRRNKRSESMRVSMRQGGRAVVESLTWMGLEGDGFALDFEPMPEVAGPQGLAERVDVMRGISDFHSPVWDRISAHYCDRVPFSAARPDEPEVDWWFRINGQTRAESMLHDALRVTTILDGAFHDPLYQTQGGDPRAYDFGAPTVELTIHYHRAALDAEWFFCRSKVQLAAAGLISGVARLWSQEGALVASAASNLACRPITVQRS